MKIENTIAQMRKGMLELCILGIISRGEAYPSDIIRSLKDARLIVVEGTLYPLLMRLKNAGLLDYTWRESPSGPPRKYYHITSKGRAFLDQLLQNWEGLVHAVAQCTHHIQKTSTGNE